MKHLDAVKANRLMLDLCYIDKRNGVKMSFDNHDPRRKDSDLPVKSRAEDVVRALDKT